MKTTNYKIKIDRKNHQLDATGQTIGRMATQIATLLRGKHKSNFSPQIDNGDFVTVTNLEQTKFTGKKIEQKIYYHHTMHPGGLRETKIKDLWQKNPQEVLKKAVYQMLPKNKLRPQMIKRLTFK